MNYDSLFTPDQSKPVSSGPEDPYPYLLIDGGGLATTAWAAHKSAETAAERVSAGIYVAITTMASLSRLIAPGGKLIVAWDGTDNRAWRRGHHPWYKHGRGTVINRAEVRVIVSAVDDLIKAMGGATVKVDGREADDVVATLARRIDEEKNSSCLVFSDDRDYVQLVNANIHLARRSLQGVVMTPEVCEILGASYGIDYLFIKAMAGDPGDNIRGLPGIGEVKAQKVVDAIPEFIEVASGDPNGMEWDRLDTTTLNAMIRAGERLAWPGREIDREWAVAWAAERGMDIHPDIVSSDKDALDAVVYETALMYSLVELDRHMELPKFSFPPVNLEAIPGILRRLGMHNETDLMSSIYAIANMRNPDATPPRTSAVRAGGGVR